MNLAEFLDSRAELENKLRNLLGRPILIIELDIFALPCGCSGVTANMRGIEIDDLDIFEPQIFPIFKEFAEKLDVKPNVIFARLVPGSSIVASINWRNLCKRCYPDFAKAKGKLPRPDLYMIEFKK